MSWIILVYPDLIVEIMLQVFEGFGMSENGDVIFFQSYRDAWVTTREEFQPLSR